MITHQLIFTLLWAGTCLYAALRGGAPERIAAAALFCAALATRWFALAAVQRYHSIIPGVALTDIVLFGILTALAVLTTRFWPILMASMQGCGMLGHVAKPLGPDIVPDAYYATVAFWGFPIVILLAVATWRHRDRLARYGIDYAWINDLPRRYREGWSIDELAPAEPR